MLKNWTKENKLILLFVLLALGVRLVGVFHTFPDILHPDEPTVVRSALGVRFYINPKHFDWPHLYIYVNYFLYMGFAFFRTLVEALGLRPLVVSILPIIWNDVLVYYLITRVLSCILGGLTVVPVYLTAKNLFPSKNNKKVNFLAAASGLLMAFLPYHVWHGQYSLIDIPMTFFLAWAMYFGSRILVSSLAKNYLLAGVFIGLAASTKYNGALAALFVVLAHLLRIYNSDTQKNKESLLSVANLRNLFLAGGSSVVFFLVGTPFALLDYDTFLRTDGPKGALWQFTNVEKVPFLEQLTKFVTLFFSKLAVDWGYTPLFAYLGTLFVSVHTIFKKGIRAYIRADSSILYVLLPSLVYIFYIAGFGKSRSHYYFIAYPAVAICAVYFLDLVVAKLALLKKKDYVSVVLVLFFVFPIFKVLINDLKRLKIMEDQTTAIEIKVEAVDEAD